MVVDLLLTTREFLLSLCERRIAVENAAGKHKGNPVFAGFVRMTEKLYELGLIPDDQIFHVTHNDFLHRHITAEVVDEAHIKVTGVRSWTDVAFCPKFVSCRAPFFLWDDEEDPELNEYNEHMALHAPEDKEMKTLKKIFEQTAGPEFLKYAYGEEYVIAHELFSTIYHGLKGTRDWDIGERLIEAFEKLHPSE